MPSIITMLMQKVLPSARKSLWIRFRKKGGNWIDFLLPPKAQKFKAEKKMYYVDGTPDFDNFTNQRIYYYVQDFCYPVKFDEAHANLISIDKTLGDQDLERAELEHQGYVKALLMKGQNKFDAALWTLVIVVLGFLVHTYMLYSIMDKMGIKLM